MLLMTSERCPQCGQIIYMVCHPKEYNDGGIIVHDLNDGRMPHAIADGCYIDREEQLWISMFDENTKLPDYYCIHCRWRS